METLPFVQSPKKKILGGMLCILVLLILAPPSFGDILIIANPSVSVSRISKSEIKKIFLGSKIAWNSNQEIRFVVIKGGPVHNEFVREYTEKTESQFNNFWKMQVFSGKGFMPGSFSTEAEIVEYVANTVGAIGYISSRTPVQGVNVLEVTPD